MTRRRWILVLTALLCLTMLPACSSSTRNLLHCSCWDTKPEEGSPPPAPQPMQPGNFYAHDVAPPLPSDNPPYQQYVGLPPSSTVTPPGQRVPELQAPPPVLSPRPATPLPLPVPPDVQVDQPTDKPAMLPPPLPEEALVEAVRCLLKKQPEAAVRCLKNYDRSNQEMFMRLLPALAPLTEKKVEQLSAAEVAALQEQVQGMLLVLRTRADLVIHTMCLCRRIDGYGQYQVVPADQAFQAGAGRQPGDHVQLYVELRNVASEQREHYFTTLLNGTVRIRDHQGDTVWSYNYRKREHPLRSREPRSDCYRAYDFYVPAMPAGKYTLTIEVVDETTQPHRVASKSVDFVVSAAAPP